MPREFGNILVVDDEKNVLSTVGICLDSLGFKTTLCAKPQEVLALLKATTYDIAFVDLKMTPLDGMEILAEIKLHSPGTSVVIMTAHGSIDNAVEAIKKGADFYLQKPFSYEELRIFVLKVWETYELRREVSDLRSQLAAAKGTDEFITRNRDTLAQLDLATRVSDSVMSVLIEGESGTGKELVAQQIHRKSSRAEKPFVKVNCAAIPEQLLESELFGHVRGAFTGAVKDRQGRFELADGGTIFLDEIAEITSSTQVKLLRVLQSKEFERVGESTPRKVDVRVIAATNRDLDEALNEATFRQDLFYRLNAIRIRLLPLRERPEDIPILIQHFIRKFAEGREMSVSPEAEKALRAYRWSGNVRELENVVQRAVLLAPNGVVDLVHLPEEVRDALEKPVQAMSLEEVEKEHIKKVLQHAKDYDEAARILGIDRATLWKKRKKFSL
ncbi:MAG TPA: sigma-54 dependent transcriptional regulator [Bacteroidota bacterium]|nr:sigma-54 dependent transcriptional regulator [Bacteroidota bacterium]